MREIFDLLFVEPDPSTETQLEHVSEKNGWSFQKVHSGKEALETLAGKSFRVALLESSLPGMKGLQILEWAKTLPQAPEFILIASHSSVAEAVKALKLGAFDYLTKPFESEERVASSVHHALEKYRLTRRMPDESEMQSQGIIGKSPQLQAVFDIIRNVSGSDSNVLIQGESGTGKELVAKAIHNLGPRKDKPFVVINCSAMPETLLESELFGYKKGSFTGAHADKEGLFEVASGGTVFLDEIGEIPLSTQVKLLRVLQEGEIRPIGDTHSRHVDVRIMAATNQDLVNLISQGTFREDLYYRLHVINIVLPPLRTRTDDVIGLAYHFMEKLGKRMGKEVDKIAMDALQALQNYTWPGNVRELENVIERALVLCDSDTITAKNLPPKILSASFYNASVPEADFSQLSYKEAKKRALNIFNRSYIMNLLEKVDGNISAAADKAGMDRSNFKKIIRKYGLHQKTRPES